MSNETAERNDILTEVQRVFGTDGRHWACLGCNGERKLKHLLCRATDSLRAPRIVEIGTHRGVSSVILSHFGDVKTFDIKDWDLRDEILDHFGASSRVSFNLCKDAADVHARIAKLAFDVAFIDGNHALKSVHDDFGAVKRCGRVIFHDYEPKLHMDRTVKFVDALRTGRITKLIPFALWESSEVLELAELRQGGYSTSNPHDSYGWPHKEQKATLA